MDVFRVSFSPELQGQLTTSGIGHIRFWQMAETFTGLKLQGQLGRFGKTSVSDIEGFVQLPDGKVVSGAEWGNILVWDGGLIKVEISREKGKPCHERERFFISIKIIWCISYAHTVFSVMNRVKSNKTVDPK